MATQGIPVEFVKKTSKNGNDYFSINLGGIGTLVIYLGTANAVLYPPVDSRDVRPASVA